MSSIDYIWNHTERSFPDHKLLHDFFEEQALRTPHAEAVKFKGINVSYCQLNERANQLASWLRNKGVKRETLVAICMDRSIELVIGLLGILKAGAAYIPMDPSYPEERLQHILADSRALVLITEESKKGLFQGVCVKIVCLGTDELDKLEVCNPEKINTSEDLCYVIYTSGSTGKPKGVGNIHKGVVNRILWMHDQYKLLPEDRVLQKTPFGFDVSVWEFFWPLMMGATLIVAEPEIHKDSEALASIIEREKITHLHFVPSMLNLFLEAEVADKCASVKKVFVSGEALSCDTQTHFFAQYDAELHNLYGPTEASIDVTYWPCNRDDKRTTVPIGYPIANTQVYILDERLSPVPIGAEGELFIGGVGLARGYIHKEELTKEKFINHPFELGKRLYRTGDLCRFLPDGAIEYIGRIDHQVKLRGFRIELGEIESVIRKDQNIRNVAVIVREDTSGGKYLCAYLIGKADEENLADQLKKTLPEYMVPSSFVFLDQFPLSPNGKLDTKRLPQPKEKAREGVITAKTPLEQQLLVLWQEVLGHTGCGIQDNFFAIGGHSLLAMRLVLKIKKGLGKTLSLPEIFLYPTIETQAKMLSEKKFSKEEPTFFTPSPESRYEPFPLTDIQRAYVFGRTDAFSLGGIHSRIYVENEFEVFDIQKLERVFNKLIARHDILRVQILEDGTQKIEEKAPPHFTIAIHEGSVQETRKSILEGKGKYYDVRCTKTLNGKTVVHFFFDLLVADGVGLEVLFEELSVFYRNEEASLPELGITYRDSILALENRDEAFESAKAYWHRRIDSLPEAPELPTKLQQQDNSPQFIRRRGVLTPKEWKNLQLQASRLGITVAALLVTKYGEVLKTWSKNPHFALNLMFFNRPPIHPDIEKLVGNMSTTLILEMNLSGNDPFEIKAQRIQKQLLEDLEHSEYNGIKVLNEANRRKGGSSLAAAPVVFACALNLRPRDETRARNMFKWYGSGVSYSCLETPQVWVDHQVFEDEDGSLCFFWDVRDEYFPKGMIEEMFFAYQKSLKVSFEEECLHTAIFEKAIQHPDKVAVITSSAALTYGELIGTALSVHKRLLPYHLSPGDLIAIVMDKGWEQLVAILAIHASGAAYIPIDNALPKERIVQLLRLSGSKVCISQRPLEIDLGVPSLIIDSYLRGPSSISIPSMKQSPNDLAYVLFTSGSTGIPKGVMIEHKAALNTIEAVNQKHQVSERDRGFAISSLSFDLSVYDIFGLLRVGGSLYIPTKEETKSPELWLKAIQEHGVTLWNSAPALMQLFMDTAEESSITESTLRLVMMSGDWIPVTLPERIKKSFSAKVVSMGGATEASIWSNDYIIGEAEKGWTSIPYGKALARQTMTVLDENLEPRPFWVTGMIYIGGKGLARGYLGDEEKTKNSFVFHPTTHERLYRTGDLGRLHPDGNIEFLGREDLQVKIQGYRIELEEIEQVCRELQEIRQVLVRIVGEKREARRLAVFYTMKTPIEPALIKEHLEKRLPFYMVPNHFVALEQFPMNSNGKVDFKALMALLKEASLGSIIEYEEPQGVQEENLARIWKELLNIEKLGRRDNFFALGGNSFLAFQMIHRAQKELELSLSLSSLFQKGTIAELLVPGKAEEDSLVCLQNEGDQNPIFFVHPSGGGVLCYAELAHLLGKKQPFFAFQSSELISSVEGMAERYVQILLKKQKTGPFLLGGWSFGGVVAFEIASQLQVLGHSVLPIIMIDSPIALERKNLTDVEMRRWFSEDYGDQLSALDEASIDSLYRIFRTNIVSVSSYHPEKAALDIIIFKATRIEAEQLKTHSMHDRDDWGWRDLSSGTVSCYLLEATHNSILKQPYLSTVIAKMNGLLATTSIF